MSHCSEIVYEKENEIESELEVVTIDLKIALGITVVVVVVVDCFEIGRFQGGRRMFVHEKKVC